ncbi:glycosyltransferase [Alkalitalea saponilacus]|uniref:Glycosyl transferases group 1 n=1 Tax=Alkalitalea saponilacus TaxID=889453 RepID=A0A1T5GZW5_9BACT|nr:glycosyltransferase [Alkalitalea saponilacus]ASB50957.1 hypothetical protein CDL62_18295 [Alkalitalea saponilacus]SKC13996.1 Glycosyl transferases group 1 [Alkalitalea saponilacus]
MNKNILFLSNNYQGGIAVFNERLVECINNSTNNSAKVLYYNTYPQSFEGKRTVINKFANKTYSYQKLKSLFSEGIICCSESIELEALNYFKYKGQIIYFLHGDYPYYYSTAKKFESIIDGFACVSELIKEKLDTLLPHRKHNIQIIKAILPIITEPNSDEPDNKNGLIFIGRAIEAKGFNYIPVIYDKLKEKGHNISLSIYCQEKNASTQNLKQKHPEITIEYGKKNDHIIKVLRQALYLIFPSKYEGLPIVVAEAMQQGVIPITSDLPILKILTNNCGFNFKYNDVNSFVNTIIKLETDTSLQKRLSNNAKEKVKKLFNTQKTLQNFKILTSIKKEKQFINYKMLCSRLDRPFIPNWLTIRIRITKTKTNKILNLLNYLRIKSYL